MKLNVRNIKRTIGHEYRKKENRYRRKARISITMIYTEI